MEETTIPIPATLDSLIAEAEDSRAFCLEEARKLGEAIRSLKAVKRGQFYAPGNEKPVQVDPHRRGKPKGNKKTAPEAAGEGKEPGYGLVGARTQDDPVAGLTPPRAQDELAAAMSLKILELGLTPPRAQDEPDAA